ncbi:MAG: DMT family transporter [bacterium]|nr:DMT family transporter [bacterium]
MMQSHLIYGMLGGLAALGSAVAWAFGSILFEKLGNDVSPLGMNLGKGIIGILYLGILLLLIGMEPINNRDFLFLALSGLLGIALGDTFFFKALMHLGPRLTILLETLGPVLTVIMAVLFLHERPSSLAWTGSIFTIAGVTWVLFESAPMEKLKENWISGVKYALLSSFCMSLGIIFAKIGVSSTSALQGTLIRFLFSVIGLTLWGTATREIKNWLLPFKNIRSLKLLLLTVFIAVFGGFWLFLVALKYIDASIATILNSTTPLFILPMVVFISKEKISPRAIIGAVIAIAGIGLIFVG